MDDDNRSAARSLRRRSPCLSLVAAGGQPFGRPVYPPHLSGIVDQALSRARLCRRRSRLKAGFQRTLPFDWSELTVDTPEGGALLLDAVEHGIGPNGLSIPLRSKQGHRGLFSMCDSGERDAWERFRRGNLAVLIEIGNRLHQRVIAEAFGEDHPHLTQREIECLHWVSLGKEAGDIAKILNISPHTARDYLKSARFKLDSVTSAQAVTKAVRLGF